MHMHSTIGRTARSHPANPATSPCPIPPLADHRAGAARVPLAIRRALPRTATRRPGRTVSLNPVLPRGLRHLEIHGPLPSGELSITHDADDTKVLRTPRGLRIALTPT